MSHNELVNRLQFCKQVGDGKWQARCPAHDDRSPSLSIKETSDGRVLIHCFGGCGALEVLQAVGLDWDDLFPDTLEHYPAKRRRDDSPSLDGMIIEMAVWDRGNGKRLSQADTERLRAALKRNPDKTDVITEIAYGMGVVE